MTSNNPNNPASNKQRKSPMSPLSRLPEPALSRGAEVTPAAGSATVSSGAAATSSSTSSGVVTHPLARSTSIHSRTSNRSASSASSSPPFPSGGQHKSVSRHLSQGAQTRPAPQPTSTQKDLFDMAVASSSLASSSEGLQALLRDHPELVSSTLSAAAGPNWNEVTESTRGSQRGSQPGTPGEESEGSEGHILKEAPSVGEGGSALGNLAGPRPNLGSTGELQYSTFE